jgi:eukaryotic-like serine/threonine-protein kinase
VDSRPPRPQTRQNLADAAAKARAAAIVGTVVSGRYRIVDLLAMGGVGAVYLAEHVHMQKHVAIKVLHPDSAGLPDLVARFEREAVVGAHIQHPNVAAATDFGELEDGSFFLVLEYVRGTTLREVISRGPLPSGRAARIGRQIAAALAAAHAMGIVHRDLKPRNVMLIEGERDLVKLIDFGIARVDVKQVSALAASRGAPVDDRITTSGAVFGTVAYLAPEASLGMDAVDARADLYALGLVLYEMLAGKHPFDTSDPVALFKHHSRTPPPSIAERTPGVFVPPALEAVVRRLLEKAPEHRYESAEATAAALEGALDVSSPTAPPMHLGDATPIFPGPSILPPALFASVPPPPASRPTAAQEAATASAGVTAPSVPASARPSASPPARRRWPLAAGGGAVALAALALWLWSPLGRGVASPAGSAAPTAPVASAAPPQPASVEPPVEKPPPPPASAAATAASGPFDGAAARTMLRRGAAVHDWVHATEAFFALVDHDPAAFHEPAMLGPSRDVAAAAGIAGGEAADRVFEALANRLGGDGIDVLYEIVRTRGGSKAATRAEELLRKSEVLGRATPEMRVTLALRDATCQDKLGLLDRAAAEGDARTLMVMQTQGAACLARNPALGTAMTALKARLRAR